MKGIIKISLSIFFIGLIASCGNKAKSEQKQQIGTYQVLDIEKASTTIIDEYPATIKGSVDVDIRPKIDGYIEEVYVHEGEFVSKGQLLFKIDNPKYKQDVASFSAAVKAAEVAVSNAQLQVNKTTPLVEKGIVSDFQLQKAKLELETQKAQLLQAKAGYSNALSNVSYTNIKSPVNGVVGNLPYRIGSYVNTAIQNPLTRISDINKVYAYFSISEKMQLEMVTNLKGKTFQDKINQLPSVNLVLSNGKAYEIQGKIETFSGQIDVMTGAYNVRAGFDNPNKLLRSGSSATIQLPSHYDSVILIPQKAVVELQNVKLAYVFKEGKVRAVEVQVKSVTGGKYYIVEKGLDVDDLLIIEGVGMLTEGTPINTKVVSMKEISDK